MGNLTTEDELSPSYYDRELGRKAGLQLAIDLVVSLPLNSSSLCYQQQVIKILKETLRISNPPGAPIKLRRF